MSVDHLLTHQVDLAARDSLALVEFRELEVPQATFGAQISSSQSREVPLQRESVTGSESGSRKHNEKKLILKVVMERCELEEFDPEDEGAETSSSTQSSCSSCSERNSTKSTKSRKVADLYSQNKAENIKSYKKVFRRCQKIVLSKSASFNSQKLTERTQK